MKTVGIPTIRTVASVTVGLVAIVAFAQQPPWGFTVLDPDGRPRANAKLEQVPYKAGMEPTVMWNLQSTSDVRDKNGLVISGFGFYGWREGATAHVAVIARLPPDGAENRFYSWPELTKSGMKPRMELLATYRPTARETKMMEEPKAVGPASLRLEMSPPKPAQP